MRNPVSAISIICRRHRGRTLPVAAMACCRNVDLYAPADVVIRGRTLPGIARVWRQIAKSQDSYFKELSGS
jgi:hypothetical protein